MVPKDFEDLVRVFSQRSPKNLASFKDAEDLVIEIFENVEVCFNCVVRETAQDQSLIVGAKFRDRYPVCGLNLNLSHLVLYPGKKSMREFDSLVVGQEIKISGVIKPALGPFPSVDLYKDLPNGQISLGTSFSDVKLLPSSPVLKPSSTKPKSKPKPKSKSKPKSKAKS